MLNIKCQFKSSHPLQIIVLLELKEASEMTYPNLLHFILEGSDAEVT